MAFSREDKILIKNLQQLKGYTATRSIMTKCYNAWLSALNNFETNCYTNL